MITARAVPALPAHHRHLAQSSLTIKDFAEALNGYCPDHGTGVTCPVGLNLARPTTGETTEHTA